MYCCTSAVYVVAICVDTIMHYLSIAKFCVYVLDTRAEIEVL